MSGHEGFHDRPLHSVEVGVPQGLNPAARSVLHGLISSPSSAMVPNSTIEMAKTFTGIKLAVDHPLVCRVANAKDLLESGFRL